MPVMTVRKVPMAVGERDMGVRMVMWLLPIQRLGMVVLMVRVMRVPVAVLQGLMLVRVFMPFGQVQPDAQSHEQPGAPEQG